MITLPCYIQKIETLKDRTGKLTIATQELIPQTAGELFGLQNSMGYLAFKVEPFTNEEKQQMEELKTDYDFNPEKSPSKRLRNVLFRVWEQGNGGYSDFNLFYISKVEEIITHYKSKLD